MIKLCSMLVFLSATVMSNAQSCKEEEKKRIMNYGFSIGLNQSVLYTSGLDEAYTLKNALGYRLGVYAEFGLSKRWRISPRSELSFNYGKIIEDAAVYRVDPYNLDIMIYSKHMIKSHNRDVIPFWNFGPNVRIPLNYQFDGETYATKVALALDFGFGFEFDLKHFKLSPELRFSGGITDIRRNPSGNLLSGSNAVLSLNFSGK